MTMRRVVAVLVAAGIAAALGDAPAASTATAEVRAADWLVAQQTAGGTFGSPAQAADLTAETVAALVAGGVAAGPVRVALAHIAEHGPARAAEQPAFAGRIAMGLRAAGRNPRAFAGTDYVALATKDIDPVTGSHDGAGLYANALAVLGALAGGEPVPDATIRYLRANECPDGGWGHARGCLSEPDADTTALNLTILSHAGLHADPLATRALGFLRTVQNGDGGFALTPGRPTNANSTGLVISALQALARDERDWARGGRTPSSALAALVHPSGGVRYDAGSDRPQLYATVQALPGLAREPYPVTPRPWRVVASSINGGPRATEPSPPPRIGDRPAVRGASTMRVTDEPAWLERSAGVGRAQATGRALSDDPAPSRTGPIAGAFAALAVAGAGVVIRRRLV